MLVEWKDELFSVGVDEIDGQHKKWIALINELGASIRTSRSSNILEKIFKDMVDYCNFHFLEEEDLMERVGFPGYEEHKLKHHDFRAMVEAYHDNLMKGEVVSRLEVMYKLVEWLKKHIQTADMKYGEFIKSKG